MDVDERRLVKARETTRQRRQTLWLLVFCLGFCIFAGGVVLLRHGQSSGDIWGAILLVGGFGIAVVGLVMAGRNRSDANSERFKATPGYRDVMQHTRAQTILIMPMTTLFATIRSLESTSDMLAGRGDLGDLFWAGLSIVGSLVTFMMVSGLDIRRDRRMKRLLEDDLIVSFRSAALGWALVVLIGGLIVAFGLSVWRPVVGISAMPLILAAAAAASAMRFAMLNYQADPNG